MKKVVIILVVVMALGVAVTVNADVTVKRQMKMEMMGMPPSDMTSIEQIQGDKSVNSTEFAGGGMMGMTGGQQTTSVNITRLDKGVMWDYSSASKTYNEMKLGEMKAMMNQPGATQKKTDEADKYDWTYDFKNEDRTTEAGYKCKVLVATATGVNKKDPADKAEVHYEFWVSPDVPGQDDLEAFNQKYTEVTGIDPFNQDEMVDKMAGDFGPIFKQMFEKTKDLKGIPVKTVITSRKTGVPAMPGMPAGEEVDPRAAEMMKKMMGGKAPEASEDGMQTVFSISTEIVNVNTDAVDAGAFEVPAGYTKQ